MEAAEAAVEIGANRGQLEERARLKVRDAGVCPQPQDLDEVRVSRQPDAEGFAAAALAALRRAFALPNGAGGHCDLAASGGALRSASGMASHSCVGMASISLRDMPFVRGGAPFTRPAAVLLRS